jgi:hypothetical protein
VSHKEEQGNGKMKIEKDSLVGNFIKRFTGKSIFIVSDMGGTYLASLLLTLHLYDI